MSAVQPETAGSAAEATAGDNTALLQRARDLDAVTDPARTEIVLDTENFPTDRDRKSVV